MRQVVSIERSERGDYVVDTPEAAIVAEDGVLLTLIVGDSMSGRVLWSNDSSQEADA